MSNLSASAFSIWVRHSFLTSFGEACCHISFPVGHTYPSGAYSPGTSDGEQRGRQRMPMLLQPAMLRWIPASTSG